LYPQISVLLRAVLLPVQVLTDTWVAAPLEDFLGLPVVNVEGEQFLAQVQLLAAVSHSVIILIDLEKEEHVVFVHFGAGLVGLQEVVNRLFDFIFLLMQLRAARVLRLR
jgi:hypothetical protein